MEKRRLIWRLSAFTLFGVILAAVLMFSNWNSDDEEPVEETLAGVYQMSQAILQSNVVDADENVIIPTGTNVTQIMGAGIFGASPCENPANSAIDQREDGKLYFVCIGSESSTQGVDAGSWSENSTLTQITLSLNATVVPPAGFQLTITDVTRSGSTVSGSMTNVPMPSQLLEAAFPGVTFPAIQLVDADVQFIKVQ
jgi:hypothetical protein